MLFYIYFPLDAQSLLSNLYLNGFALDLSVTYFFNPSWNKIVLPAFVKAMIKGEKVETVLLYFYFSTLKQCSNSIHWSTRLYICTVANLSGNILQVER